MKTFTNKELNYSLQNVDNYKKELENDITDVAKKISELFVDYFIFITENVKIKKNMFSRFIIIRGLDTIVNTFNHILFYTKNLDLTYFHCQKAFIFYVEFVGQISEDEKMFLQLNSRDATRYVYNKTIFGIDMINKMNNEIVSNETRVKLDIINNYIELYKTILLKLINTNTDENKIRIVGNIYNKLNNIIDKSKIKLLNDIIETFYHKINDDQYFFNVCELISKKLIKNPDLFDNCYDKFLFEEFDDKLLETPDKFITWFLN